MEGMSLSAASSCRGRAAALDLAFGAKATDWGNPALSAFGARANGDVRPANGKVSGGGGAQAANGKPGVELEDEVDAVQGKVQGDGVPEG